jgi:hypothetical protein
MLRMKPFLPLLLAAGLTVGCIEGLQPAREKTGFVSFTMYRDAIGNEFMRPVGAFYKYDGLTLENYSTDTCFFANYSETTPTLAFLPTLQAGEVLITEVSGETDSMFMNTEFGLLVYQALEGTTIPMTPGDTLDLTIPGAFGGFPAANLSIKTAEDFRFTTPDTAARDVPMPVEWTAATAPGSRMRLSFRFASSVATTTPDRQLFCDLADDGAYTMSAVNADAFRLSPYEYRSWVATRVRTRSTVLEEDVTVHLVSSYQQPLPLYVP